MIGKDPKNCADRAFFRQLEHVRCCDHSAQMVFEVVYVVVRSRLQVTALSIKTVIFDAVEVCTSISHYPQTSTVGLVPIDRFTEYYPGKGIH